MHVFHSLSHHSHIAFLMLCEHRILVDPQCVGVRVRDKYVYNWLSRDANTLRGHAFLKPELASNAKIRQWHSKKHDDQRTLSYPFLLITSL